MADFTRSDAKKPQTLSIDSFRGINLFSPVNGESTNMKNFKVMPDLKLKKRAGTKLLSEFGDTVRGAWYGRFINEDYALYVCAGTQIVKYISGTDSKIVIGNINGTSSGHVNIFYAYSRLYFLDGQDFYIYNGVEFKPVESYIPLMYDNLSTGGSSSRNVEAPNLLTDIYISRYKPFSDSDMTFVHRHAVRGVAKVVLNGVDLTNDFNVTVDPATNYVTVSYKYARLPNTGYVELHCIGMTDSRRDEIFSARYHAIFGDHQLPRLFVYGGTVKNQIYYTEKLDTREAMYVLAGNSLTVGEEKNAVTSVIRQFEDLMIFTEGDAWAIRDPVIEKDIAFNNMHYTYSLTMISSSIGNIGFDNVKSIENNLISIGSDGLYSWAITKIFDERNVKFVSDKLYKGMSEEFIKNAFTFYNRSDGEIWLAYGGEVWIYNYKLDAWYYYDNIYTNGFLMTEDVTFYYGNKVYVFDENCCTDNGLPIEAVWESNYMDFDYPQYTKNISRMYLTVKDVCNINTVKIKSDRDTEVVFADIKNDTDAPMTFRRRMNITRCGFIKMSLTDCNTESRLTIMNIKFSWVRGSEGR